ncbi:hypothetical protein, variant [Verruconis gallopava]|nr:hypothetical protein, variant [Verruconis gallopava]KIW04194.1 hypothetical protein, variant [Verruconis gallopava]
MVSPGVNPLGERTVTPNRPSSQRSSSAQTSVLFGHVDTARSQDHKFSSSHATSSDLFRPSSAISDTFSLSSQFQRPSVHAYTTQFPELLQPSTPLFPIHEDDSFDADPVVANIGGFDTRNQRVDPLRRRATAVESEQSKELRADSPVRLDTAPAISGHGSTCSPSSRIALMERPSTTSKMTIVQLDSDLSAMIPPRRELPFKRPESRQSAFSRDRSASRPSSSADLSALPKPNFIEPAPIESVMPTRKHGTSAENDLTRNLAEGETKKRYADTKEATSLDVDAAGAERPNTATSTQSKRIRLAKETGIRLSTSLSTPSASNNVSDDAPMTSEKAAGTNNITDNLRNALDRVGSAMTPTSPQIACQHLEKENLASYAGMPYEERMAVLEKLIVEGVADENFITLCEDVFGCWQRIGLGR